MKNITAKEFCDKYQVCPEGQAWIGDLSQPIKTVFERLHTNPRYMVWCLSRPGVLDEFEARKLAFIIATHAKLAGGFEFVSFLQDKEVRTVADKIPAAIMDYKSEAFASLSKSAELILRNKKLKTLSDYAECAIYDVFLSDFNLGLLDATMLLLKAAKLWGDVEYTERWLTEYLKKYPCPVEE